MRGFVSGGIWGLVLGGVTVAGASLVGEQPARNDPPAVPQVAAPDVQSDTSQSESPETQSAEVDADAVLQSDAPLAVTPDDAAEVAVVDTAPALPPETSDVVAEVEVPAEGVLTGVDITAEVPVLPNPQSVVPIAPDVEAPVAVDTMTAEPLPGEAPEIADDAPVLADAAPQDADSPDVDAVAETLPIAPTAPDVLDAPEAGDTAEIAGTDAPAAIVIDDDAAADDEEPVVVAIIDDPATSALPGGTGAVRVNRLAGDTAAEEAEVAVEDDVENTDGMPALERYAAEAANPDNRPEVSVVLMDDGSFDGAVSAVAGVAFPITVMLNPSVPNATERMKAYRAAGIEVGVLAALPASATATDVEIFFEAAFNTLPETVAVLDAGEAGLQSDPEVISQTIAALSEDGRGLVTVPRGLNSALRVADEQGVPTSLIFRNLDSENQDARVIRRFMDQAAFRARQESGVVLLGQIRGETISALIQWGAANRASQVAMVPISTVLMVD
ncbi:polysaccharide deacetylase 2 family uncharacterized protein YibQ [Loktanella ponticola]|uniref:Polysaccharide deacetylase 2 family uncharacterized protein YibQ n=1 Tax=Yoonia ponticola TaxID=1524255 RepID=A0A7W9EXG9_9RHOB|nr:polysaccharide deacetylase 2 family uncharacterized protein YibQ [Yoonia ponticola]